MDRGTPKLGGPTKHRSLPLAVKEFPAEAVGQSGQLLYRSEEEMALKRGASRQPGWPVETALAGVGPRALSPSRPHSGYAEANRVSFLSLCCQVQTRSACRTTGQ